MVTRGHGGFHWPAEEERGARASRVWAVLERFVSFVGCQLVPRSAPARVQAGASSTTRVTAKIRAELKADPSAFAPAREALRRSRVDPAAVGGCDGRESALAPSTVDARLVARDRIDRPNRRSSESICEDGAFSISDGSRYSVPHRVSSRLFPGTGTSRKVTISPRLSEK